MLLLKKLKFSRIYPLLYHHLKNNELQSQLRLTPDDPTTSRIVKLAIVGSPNAGKSTLANMLMGWRYTSVSNKVHTTKKKALGVLTEGDTQIIFLDTPGIISEAKRKRHNLDYSLLNDPGSVLSEADLIAVIVDVSNVWNRTRLDVELIQALNKHTQKHCILVLNKIDYLNRKKQLLQVTRKLTNGIVGGVSIIAQQKKQLTIEDFSPSNRDKGKDMELKEKDRIIQELLDIEDLTTVDLASEKYKDIKISNIKRMKKTKASYSDVKEGNGWSHFDSVFMTSALNGDGIQDLKNYIIKQSKQSDWLYHSSVITDSSPVEIAVDCIKEKLLDNLSDDIPYCIDVKLSFWEVDENGLLRATFDLMCDTKRHMFAAIGPKGETIKRISQQAKQDLMNIYRRELSLQLKVNHKKS